MPFDEYTIMLQDIAYHLGLLIDGHYVSGCLTKFERYIKGSRPAWTWFEELLEGADEETVRRYARAYIMMLLSMQFFRDKSGTRMHIWWLPYMERLEDMDRYSWGSATLSWLYRCLYLVDNKHVVKLAGSLQDHLATQSHRIHP
ncbi:hypothetical protein Ahy_A03g014131 isoform B [Arachis hypogaea]|uniref:Aminotransferase-like plant mobile domain-containing protein n=1 Tax=Arachis hypogaea TaxID=3818 RepID=A0A445DX19_ARAHY|nr:hypothetical protein Ahy_A03g014131 isoform B [Arachis hypogaea]